MHNCKNHSTFSLKYSKKYDNVIFSVYFDRRYVSIDMKRYKMHKLSFIKKDLEYHFYFVF